MSDQSTTIQRTWVVLKSYTCGQQTILKILASPLFLFLRKGRTPFCLANIWRASSSPAICHHFLPKSVAKSNRNLKFATRAATQQKNSNDGGLDFGRSKNTQGKTFKWKPNQTKYCIIAARYLQQRFAQFRDCSGSSYNGFRIPF